MQGSCNPTARAWTPIVMADVKWRQLSDVGAKFWCQCSECRLHREVLDVLLNALPQLSSTIKTQLCRSSPPPLSYAPPAPQCPSEIFCCFQQCDASPINIIMSVTPKCKPTTALHCSSGYELATGSANYLDKLSWKFKLIQTALTSLSKSLNIWSRVIVCDWKHETSRI